jgi:hypothetical protein
MKKLYIAPTVEYIQVSSADIITTSDETKLPWVPLPTGEDEMIS